MNSFCRRAAHHLLAHEIRLVPLLCIGTDVIGEEKEFDDDENDNKFDDNDRPKCFSQGHAPEPLIVEVEGLV